MPNTTAWMISLDLIHSDPTNVRLTKLSEIEEAMFRASLREQGQIQPIVLRPMFEGSFIIVAGERRVRHARALEWSTISAVVQQMDDVHARAVQVAENAHRAAMHPIDTWRAMVSMMDGGMAMTLAAQCLGISDTRARQLDKLGRIAPPLIEAMRKYGIPSERFLAEIVAAPADSQAKVFKQHAKGAGDNIHWYAIANALRAKAIPQAYAIFDLATAKIAWQEDVFAEPGSKEAFTTTDAKAFITYQRDALEALVAKRKKAKHAIELADIGPGGHEPILPSGYVSCYDTPPRSMKLPVDDPRLLVMAIAENGEIVERLIIRKGKKVPTKPAKASTSEAAETRRAGGDDEDKGGEDEEVAPATPAAPRTKTTSGRAQLAIAQTAAIAAKLAEDGPTMDELDLLRLLCLAVTGNNIDVRRTRFGRERFTDVQAKLLIAEGEMLTGTFRDLPVADLCALAADVITRLVVVDEPAQGFGSGPIAMAIGHFIDAEAALAPLDAPEFLATLSTGALKEAAAACGLTGAKTAKLIRERLAGKIGTVWRPAEAAFVFPGIRVAPCEPDNHSADGADAGEEDANEPDEGGSGE